MPTWKITRQKPTDAYSVVRADRSLDDADLDLGCEYATLAVVKHRDDKGTTGLDVQIGRPGYHAMLQLDLPREIIREMLAGLLADLDAEAEAKG